MSGALCIDFGTSSIRAVRRQPSGKLKTLDIGRVTRSKLDDASIRCEIHVDEPTRAKAAGCIERMLDFVKQNPGSLAAPQRGFVKHIGAA